MIAGYVREQNAAGTTPWITKEMVIQLAKRQPPSVRERAYALLREVSATNPKLSTPFGLQDPRLQAATYSADFGDVRYLADMLVELEMFRGGGGGDFTIRPKAYAQAEELRRDRRASSQGFIAMWFHKDMDLAYESGLQVGVLNAGYMPVRIDRVEHVGRIDDEIIVQIDRSRFVVADFSGHRGGVYFEAGYAVGKGIPVIWTCRKRDMKNLHFDIRQYNTIEWDDYDQLARRLAFRIEAAVGPGPAKVNV